MPVQDPPSGVEALPGIAIVGGGPAGLMAAEVARAAGGEVDLFEAKGSVGRKFLIAGKGGLNLTHAEPMPGFGARYGLRRDAVGAWLRDLGPDELRRWARGLGVETYVGTSDRVFPLDRKAAPLLRGWVRGLKDQGVRFHVQHRWLGWDESGTSLRFETPAGIRRLHAGATVLALGGGSWPQLGSDGAWVAALQDRGIDVAPLLPSNCGFDVDWSGHFAARHAGAPLKPVVAYRRDAAGVEHALQGECVATSTGIEGSLVYALSVPLRDAIARDGQTTLWLDLVPGRTLERLSADLAKPRNGRSLSEHLRRQAGIEGVKAALLREVLDADALADMQRIAATLKRLPLVLRRPRPIDEAISSGGGVRLEALDEGLMSRELPGVFCAGEMLDWEAPTGGYLLTACFASGQRAGLAAARWCRESRQ
ncbi:TIGR03862 family flavoprotein [Pseudoxanthomonas daejeonensis]|uniref:Aminoacetone oxidase family FAD-binding enzyme n=1 Tax=Pseudoxanthomonas daejeonensis TaxID=266062 RepID=A0ABQ6Z690_9GAMM|nr:TIGR03862 family flavoprotein [Pseudoxanthomonas daejeonensis]KAF1693975.1 aminoacetone oxidase family FAD-binding enzyme [Pseudoxanthomonas daejeonensis]